MVLSVSLSGLIVVKVGSLSIFMIIVVKLRHVLCIVVPTYRITYHIVAYTDQY